MNKYLIVTGDFVETGGMDRANYALAHYLAGRGHEVHLAAYRTAPDLLEYPNVTWHRVPKPLNSYVLGGPLLDRVGRRLAGRVAASGGRVVVNGGNCRWGDVNWVHHVNVLDPPSVAGSMWKRSKDRIAHRVHVVKERAIVPLARVVVATCERTRRDAIEHLGARPEHTHIVYLGVDSNAFHPAEPARRLELRARLGCPGERPLVGFVGALGNRRKGFDTLFAAFQALCREPAWDADLVVVGRGAEASLWHHRAQAAGLAERIFFRDFVPNVAELFQAVDAHVLPSRYEGYSLVTQEALACGAPAFVTATAGIADRYPEELRNLLLIPDPDDITDLIARLSAWRPQAAAIRAAVAPFSQQIRAQSWATMAAQIAELIDRQPRARGEIGAHTALRGS